jgi:hypothetical protein
MAKRPSWLWVLVPICAVGFLIWIDAFRAHRVIYATTAVGDTAVQAGWRPSLIVPEHANASFEWLDQTRQMFARRDWRVRHIDYENAPFGHAVYAASPYRWWLGLVAACDHGLTGRPIGESVERAALVADPLLHFLLLAGTVIFVAAQFGVLPAVLVSLALATLFPFAEGFIPGAPDDQTLVGSCALWSLLPLMAGLKALYSGRIDARTHARRWFAIGGLVGGLGLWIGVAGEAPILVGIGLGALLAAWAARAGGVAGGTPPWRAWGIAGAVATVGGYLAEFFPGYLASWQLRAVHPLFALAWLGGGEILARASAQIQGPKTRWSLGGVGLGLIGLAAVAAVPLAMWRRHDLSFLSVELAGLRLTRLPEGASALNLAQWLAKDGVTIEVCATLLPLLLLPPGLWLLLRKNTDAGPRVAVALTLGPVLVALGFACRQLRWWNQVDAVLFALVIAVTVALVGGSQRRLARWLWSELLILVLLPGATQTALQAMGEMRRVVNVSEVYELVERDLARWLAAHAGQEGSVVLAPYNQTFTLYYYGGLRGLATLDWENRDGLEAAVRITSASTPEEAKELIDRRAVRYLVIPSWDPYLDVYARIGMGQLEGTFLERVHYWRLPPWLRPVAYQFPTIAGFEGQSVTVLEVVDEQDEPVQLSRVAEYFIAMGQVDQAASVARALRRFPANMGAWVARAQVAIAREDEEGRAGALRILVPRLKTPAVRALPWDRRVALAVVLAQSKRMDLAGEVVRRCLAEADATRLRSLTTGSLYSLLAVGRRCDCAIADPGVRQAALDLLPEDLRRRFEP